MSMMGVRYGMSESKMVEMFLFLDSLVVVLLQTGANCCFTFN